MRRALATLALMLTAAGAAQADPAIDAEAAMLRSVWRAQAKPAMTIVQRVYTRVVAFELPRGFVIGSRSQSPKGYLVEYIPDGETVDRWTRMITVTGNLGVGRARRAGTGERTDDVTLAALIFDPKTCPGRVYRDLGPAPPQPVVTGRAIVIGCGAAAEPGSERGAIAFYRDDANAWTVQYAERNNGTAPFDVAAAAGKLAKLKIAVACSTGDATPACSSGARR